MCSRHSKAASSCFPFIQWKCKCKKLLLLLVHIFLLLAMTKYRFGCACRIFWGLLCKLSMITNTYFKEKYQHFLIDIKFCHWCWSPYTTWLHGMETGRRKTLLWHYMKEKIKCTILASDSGITLPGAPQLCRKISSQPMSW